MGYCHIYQNVSDLVINLRNMVRYIILLRNRLIYFIHCQVGNRMVQVALFATGLDEQCASPYGSDKSWGLTHAKPIGFPCEYGRRVDRPRPGAQDCLLE